MEELVSVNQKKYISLRSKSVKTGNLAHEYTSEKCAAEYFECYFFLLPIF